MVMSVRRHRAGAAAAEMMIGVDNVGSTIDDDDDDDAESVDDPIPPP